MKTITKDDWTLTLDGKPVVSYKPYATFRGDTCVIVGGRPPHKDGSEGFVYTEAGQELYASVFDMKWVRGPLPPPGYTADELERDNPYNQWMYEC